VGRFLRRHLLDYLTVEQFQALIGPEQAEVGRPMVLLAGPSARTRDCLALPSA
jgi:hypothetical protein